MFVLVDILELIAGSGSGCPSSAWSLTASQIHSDAATYACAWNAKFDMGHQPSSIEWQHHRGHARKSAASQLPDVSDPQDGSALAEDVEERLRVICLVNE